MAITGVILVLFIIGHCVGNMQIFVGKDAFNSYAYFLQERLGELLWLIRIGLFVAAVFHIITSIRLKFLNLGAKPTKYQVKNYVKARLTSRTMIWTGIMIFAFLTYHILHFTMGVVHPEDYNKHEYYVSNAVSVEKVDNGTQGNSEGTDECCAKEDISSTGKSVIKYNGSDYKVEGDEPILSERHDAYAMVISGFQKPIVSILYILGVILLGFHLNHAIQSSVQTLGYNNPKYFQKIVAGSTIISVILVLCYISLPISILLGLVGGGV
jgi:succinate dehydrogenase / fumarate reductase cytochrome b subunit